MRRLIALDRVLSGGQIPGNCRADSEPCLPFLQSKGEVVAIQALSEFRRQSDCRAAAPPGDVPQPWSGLIERSGSLPSNTGRAQPRHAGRWSPEC